MVTLTVIGIASNGRTLTTSFNISNEKLRAEQLIQ
ncbi:hypothetical protein MCAP_0592 [Mycoplasma capricolum subsp. capricolum ATCC 27343]|uniref:Uncharacterized protein n=1 Tax=Mycoplasma capricolum subsp. capricolum (strain California kid / ATCC 27343 / NCTC 10154) TaxID=340047 RepID=Q2SRQ3_MYCCT|nr:hypothetical protein MCAP_0592 [Mycoplasma capricolum subsp. capricolum ATCC 27343]